MGGLLLGFLDAGESHHFLPGKDLPQSLLVIRQQKGPGRGHIENPLVEPVFHLQTGEIQVHRGALVEGRQFPMIIEAAAIGGGIRQEFGPGRVALYLETAGDKGAHPLHPVLLGSPPQDGRLQVHLLTKR